VTPRPNETILSGAKVADEAERPRAIGLRMAQQASVPRMKSHVTAQLVSVALFTLVVDGSRPHAQSILDRLVGAQPVGGPVTISEVTPQAVGILSAASGVPMGVETATPPARRVSAAAIVATGKPLRDVLAKILADQ